MTAVPPKTPQEPRGLGFGSTVGLSLLMGLFAGSMFGLRETVRVSLTCTRYAPLPSSLVAILAIAGYSMWWYAVGGGVLLAAIGALIWMAARSRGQRLDDAKVLGLTAAAFTFICMPVAVWYAVQKPDAAYRFVSRTGRLYLALEAGLIGLLCAVALGVAIHAATRVLRDRARLASAALGALGGLFALACWATWLNHVVIRAPNKPASLLGDMAVLVVAVVLGAGVHLVSLSVLARSAPTTKRRRWVGAAMVAVAAAGLAGAPLLMGHWSAATSARAVPASAPQRRRDVPNVVLLVMDTTRADALSCYGSPRKTSPHIDQIAAEGTLYERAYANAPWTLPSHATMFTGLLPSQHGATGENMHLDDRFVTLAEVLSKHGYRTFGWSANANISRRANTAQGFERFVLHPFGKYPQRFLLANLAKDWLHLTDYGARHANALAKQWIRQCQEAGDPFFIFINYMEMHSFYGSTPNLRRWFASGRALRKALSITQYVGHYGNGTASTAPENFRLLRTLYDGDMTYLDRCIGELADYLRSLGILDNTLLIITSDHGEEFGEHRLVGHSFGIYNSLLHVPLIIRYPKRFAPGRRHRQLAQLSDLFPTILDALDIPCTGTHPLDGRSLLAPLKQGTRPYAVAEKHYHADWIGEFLGPLGKWNGIPLQRRLRCIQDDRFKYIWSSLGHDELYDLREDPQEQKNLIASLPAQARKLHAALEAKLGRRLWRAIEPLATARAAAEPSH